MRITQDIPPRLVVAVTGAQGLGKSTLASAIAKEFNKLAVGPCITHQGLGQTVAARGLPLGQSATASTIMEFARLHVHREQLCNGGVHLLDRCFVDLLAYVRVVCFHDTFLVELIEELTRTSLARIDLVVQVPLIPSLAECRSTNETTQLRVNVDAAISQILSEFSRNKMMKVGDTPTEERARQVLSALRERSLLQRYEVME